MCPPLEHWVQAAAGDGVVHVSLWVALRLVLAQAGVGPVRQQRNTEDATHQSAHSSERHVSGICESTTWLPWSEVHSKWRLHKSQWCAEPREGSLCDASAKMFARDWYPLAYRHSDTARSYAALIAAAAGAAAAVPPEEDICQVCRLEQAGLIRGQVCGHCAAAHRLEAIQEGEVLGPQVLQAVPDKDLALGLQQQQQQHSPAGSVSSTIARVRLEITLLAAQSDPTCAAPHCVARHRVLHGPTQTATAHSHAKASGLCQDGGLLCHRIAVSQDC